jgi:uncharacterized protein
LIESCPEPNAWKDLGNFQDSAGPSTLCAKPATRKPEPRAVEPAITQPSSPPRYKERSLVMTSPQNEKQQATNDLVELSEADCRELLAQHTAGRIGFMAGDGPLILPVTYQYRNGSVIFRTSPVGPLAGLVRRTSVAFEIDEINEQSKSGWSVLVLGFAEAMAHNYLLTSAWETGPVPWADGVRNLFVEIKPRKISGRAVRGSSRH